MILLSGLSLVFNKMLLLLLNIFFKLIGNKFPHFRRSTTSGFLFCTLNIFLFTFLSQLEFSQFSNYFRNDQCLNQIHHALFLVKLSLYSRDGNSLVEFPGTADEKRDYLKISTSVFHNIDILTM